MDEAALWDLMNAAWHRMTFRQKHLWETIRIDPQRWEQRPYGIGNGGFWVVALIGRTVLWYNDLEYGFQRSSYAAMVRSTSSDRTSSSSRSGFSTFSMR